MKEEGIASTGREELKAMSPGFQPLLTQELLVSDLPTPIPNLVRNALSQRLEVLCDASVGENYRNEDIESVKEQWDRLQEDVNA